MGAYTLRRRRFLKTGQRVLVASVTAIVFWTITLMIFEDRFIFFPSTYPDGPYEDLAYVPNARDIFFVTEDRVRLHGIYAPAESSNATVIFFHGNAGNLSHRIDFLRRAQQAGISMFLFDYRGYGKSDGSPDEAGVYQDGRAAYDTVRDTLHVDPASVILWGRSLGGAVAVDVAVHRNVSALILESTFSSAADVAASAYPFLPFLGSLMKTEFDSARKIASLHLPSLHIHGPLDAIIPIKLGQKLYDAAAGPKEFYRVEGAGHNDCYSVGGTPYLERIGSFIRHSVAR